RECAPCGGLECEQESRTHRRPDTKRTHGTVRARVSGAIAGVPLVSIVRRPLARAKGRSGADVAASVGTAEPSRGHLSFAQRLRKSQTGENGPGFRFSALA